MLACLITHPGDRQLTVNLCARIQQLGGVRGHECLVVSPIGTNMEGVVDVLKKCFGNVFVHQYAETMKGWPAGPNEAVSHAMVHLWSNPALRYHYLILEPDCVPANDRWLDMIDMAYRQGGNGAHVLGVKTETRNQHGAVMGRHTVGVAVYPKNWPELCSPVKSLTAMSYGYVAQQASPPPWDAYCGPYTNRCTVETNLIQHFTLQPTSEGGKFHWDCTVESALAQVSPRAVLLHGCKHPEFLSRLTGFKPQPIETHATPIREIQSHDPQKHLGASPRATIREDHTEAGSQNGQQASRGNSTVPSPEKEITLNRRAQLDSMKWPQFKSYATKLGAKTHKVSRPELTTAVLEIEERELAKPVEEAIPAPPLEPVGVSVATMTAVPWNDPDAVPQTNQGGTHSDPMQKAMLELIADRKKRGLM